MDYKKYNDYELLYLLTWHSEEAMEILIKKYELLIKSKLRKFNIMDYHYADYFQELRMAVIQAIKTYNESYGKTLCRYIELIIDRRIIRLLENDTIDRRTVCFLEDNYQPKKDDVLQTMSYESRIQEIRNIKLDEIKRSILNDVLLGGVSIKEFATNNNLSVKDVYNHVYLLRCKLKEKD